MIGLIAMCLSTALIPVWTALNLGQVGIVLMLLVVVDMLAPRSVLPRGALVGIAAAVKLTPAGFILFPLLRRDWRTAGRERDHCRCLRHDGSRRNRRLVGQHRLLVNPGAGD